MNRLAAPTIGMECPYCGRDRVQASRVRWYEQLLVILFNKKPYRCLGCERRFWVKSTRGGE